MIAMFSKGLHSIIWCSLMFLTERVEMEECTAQELLELFEQHDPNGTGFLRADGLKSIIWKLGRAMTVEQAEEAIRDYDEIGTGTITFPELCKIAGVRVNDGAGPSDTALRNAFSEHCDGNNQLDAAGLKDLFQSLNIRDITEEDAKAFIEEESTTGMFTFDQFNAFMKKPVLED